MIRIFTLICITFLTSPLSFAQTGQVYISVGQAKVKKSLLAIPPFVFYGTQTQPKKSIEIGATLYETVKNDLDVSSLFAIMDPAGFLEDSAKVGLKPQGQVSNGFDFAKWTPLKTDFLIKTGFKIAGDKLTVDTFLYYVPQAKLVLAKSYAGTVDSVRTVAHILASDVIEALTGKGAMFNSKVVFTANRSGQHKEIYTMDWDGFNIKQITNFKNLAISPSWSTDNSKVAFTAWAYHSKAKTRNADLFIHDLKKGGKPQLLSYKKGINSGAAFDPNGEDLYLTISKSGNADIYKMNLNTKSLTAITRGPAGAMNVEPTPSPDGTKLAYSSDRTGRPMIFIKDLKTNKDKRVTFAGHYNSTPSWSPDGKKLAFAGFDKKKGNFDIFIMDSTGFNLERLTTANKASGQRANNQSPTFSPDGRHIMFVSDRTGASQLYIINVDGTNERRITKDNYNYEKPKWSGILNK